MVSNIGNNITADYLIHYLSTELNIKKEEIRITSLANNRHEFSSSQYRVSTPERHYDTLMTSSTWPRNVKIRDYVFKSRNPGVKIENFREKEDLTRARNGKSIDQSASDTSTYESNPAPGNAVLTSEVQPID